MHPVSRRDKQVLEQLLPLLDREITADPGQYDPRRRATRRQDVAHAKLLLSEERRAEEVKKDSELRAKIDSESQISSFKHMTDRTDSRVVNVPPRFTSHFENEKPGVTIVQPIVRSNCDTGSIHQVDRRLMSQASNHRKSLACISSEAIAMLTSHPWLT
jgi:hypothetical protein